MSSEAEVHFELYCHLKNVIDEEPEFYGVRFEKVLPEESVDGGFADIIVKNHKGDFLVIEAKRKIEKGYDRNIDPYSPKVIEQAFEYANKKGSPYFATYNGKQLVLFKSFERGVPLLQRQAKSYNVTDPKKFASTLLEQVAGIEKEKVGWEPKPDIFVKRLKSFYDRLSQEFAIKLGWKLKKSGFKAKFEEWIDKQGWDIGEEEEENRFTSQAAYLLMNKLLFYKILEDTL